MSDLNCAVPAVSSHMKLATTSTIDSCTCCPPAPRSRASNAAVMAWLTCIAVSLSANNCWYCAGSPVCASVWLIATPAKACTTLSYAALPDIGPA